MSQILSNAFDRPLQLELRRSALLTRLLCGLYGLAAFVWLWVPMTPPLRVVLYGVMALQLGFTLRSHALVRGRGAVSALAWDRGQGWRLRRQGDWLPVQLQLPVLVTHRFAAVRFRGDGWRRYRLLVCADRLEAQDFRRLRVRLLQSAHATGDRTQVPGTR